MAALGDICFWYTLAMTDKDFLAEAIAVGNEVAAPYNFGAVVVMNGKIVGKAHGDVQTTHNPSLHSEVCALAEAGKTLGNWQMDGVTLYCSHEPCVMCFSCAAVSDVKAPVLRKRQALQRGGQILEGKAVMSASGKR